MGKKQKSKAITKMGKTNNILEKPIEESQDMLQTVINNVPQHIFWKDINSVFLGCNKNFANAVGLQNPADIVGKTDFDLADEEKANHFIKIDKKVIKENTPIYNMQECHKKANGEEIWLNVNKIPLCNKKGKVIGILGTFEDITANISLSQKLEKNAKKYKTLIEQTNTAYIILDTNLCIIETNETFSSLLGLSGNQNLIGRNPRSWVIADDIGLFDSSFKQLLSGQPMNDIELGLINDNGKIINVSISANIIENGGKRIFCLIRNISHRKREENKEYIAEQKKKDGFRQNIMEIRDEIKKLRFREGK